MRESQGKTNSRLHLAYEYNYGINLVLLVTLQKYNSTGLPSGKGKLGEFRGG